MRQPSTNTIRIFETDKQFVKKPVHTDLSVLMFTRPKSAKFLLFTRTFFCVYASLLSLPPFQTPSCITIADHSASLAYLPWHLKERAHKIRATTINTAIVFANQPFEALAACFMLDFGQKRRFFPKQIRFIQKVQLNKPEIHGHKTIILCIEQKEVHLCQTIFSTQFI